MPKLSFVIPYYKKEKSIAKCLKSLYAQSFKDLEVIVVFDGEDKEGEKIVDKFLKKGVKKIVIPHGGAPRARNAGLAAAVGEYISFWDADCYIESGAADVWMQVFKKYPDVDFVYSSYKFYPDGMGAIEAQPFDPWLLQVNNYISGMFPIKREKCPQWDENLKSLQDWDLWLTAVENGCRGFYLKGYGFKTDYPTKDSISGSASNSWLERLETVKNKHNITLRETCVSSIQDREMGIVLAKIIDADYRDMPTYFPNKYKTIIQIGFSPRMADVYAQNFHNPHSKSKNILFWRGVDAHSLRSEASRDSADALATILNARVEHQFCDNPKTKELMTNMGFNVEVLPLPLNFKDDEIKPFGKFKVLMDVSKEYGLVFDSIKNSMPDVEFVDFENSKEASEYTVMVRFQPDRSLDQNLKKFLLNGRYVISNVKHPHCGFVSDMISAEDTKKEIVREIRRLQDVTEINQSAVNWYRRECSPETFKEKLNEKLKEPVTA